jgi:hypothetical protein
VVAVSPVAGMAVHDEKETESQWWGGVVRALPCPALYSHLRPEGLVCCHLGTKAFAVQGVGHLRPLAAPDTGVHLRICVMGGGG